MQRITKRLLVLLSAFASALVSAEQSEDKWQEIGDTNTLSEIISYGYLKGSKAKTAMNDIHKFIRAALPVVESIDCAKSEISKEKTEIFASARFDYSITPEAFIVICDFRKKQYEIRETKVGEENSVSVSFSVDYFDVIADGKLCALVNARISKDELSIEEINRF